MTWTTGWVPLWILIWFLVAILPPRRWQGAAMLAVGAAFVAWADWRGLAAIVGTGLVAWLLLRGARPPPWRAGAVIALVVAGFVATKWGAAVDAGGAIMGVAFASLRLIHVAVEAAQGRVDCRDGWDLLRYLLLFPAVIAGPIHRFDEQQRDERRRRWDSALVAQGAERVLYGFTKIVLVAGWLDDGAFARAAASEAHPALAAWLGCFRYGWDLYFQFSGYSDVSIGLALAAGFRLPENFRFPFLATDLQEFWRRWHATLSAWCRAYVAEPVMAATRSRWLAVIASMLILGLWHEFSLRYCLWGLFHGLGIAAVHQWRTWRGNRAPGGLLARAGGLILTQAFVIMSFAITSSADTGAAWHLVLRMLCLEGR